MIWNFLRVHINRLMQDGHDVECACSKTGFFYDDLQSSGLVLHQVPFTRNPFSLQNLKSFCKLNRLIQEQSYDAVFCHEPVGGAMGRIVSCFHKLTVVYMAHGFHFYKQAPFINKLLYKPIEWMLSWKTNVLITINEEDYRASLNMHAKKNILLNGIGVDCERFNKFESRYLQNKLKRQNQPNPLILLSVGELIERKNHQVIIETIHKMNNTNIIYFIAGDGDLRNRLLDLVKTYNLEKQVYLLGYCKNISELCNSCDVFVLPSFQEGLSLALMEAMACGKPVIASDIRGNTDLIKKDGGFLVKVDDVIGYEKSIRVLYENSSLRIQMGEYNRKMICKYDIGIIKEEISNIFKTL